MARPPKNPEAAGVYRRGDWFWLRHSVEGTEIRQPLRTQIYEEAISKAKELRGQIPSPEVKIKGGWDSVIENYLREKQSPKRPPNFTGKRWLTFRPGTVIKVRSCLKKFAAWAGVANPSKVTVGKLEAYLVRVSKKSNAGGRTTLATIQAFLSHIGCLPGRIQLPERKSLERREVVVSIATANKLILEAPTDALRFVLFCGFHAGLRRGEIMHARATWFRLDRGILRVPRFDKVAGHLFQVKDSETREIPLSAEFASFAECFLKQTKQQKYCLSNPTERRSKSGTYDFRRPFQKFMETAGHPEIFPHAMRHSWITELCNSGNHSIQEVSAWSGDSIQTIEKNYWHKKATKGALDDTMQGKRSGDTMKEAMRLLKTMSTSGLDKETTAAIQNLLKVAAKKESPKWEWTEIVPLTHQNLYSVEDTVSKFGVFVLVINPEDEVAEASLLHQWEEGNLSTKRARLKILEDMGWIKRN
jgi:integrase